MTSVSPNPNEKASNTPFFVVGIGASAGGLEASRALLRSNTDTRACYLLCQHLSPHNESMLVDILAKDTELIVKQAIANESIQIGHLYIAPPNTNLELKDNRIVLTEPKPGPYAKPNINQFFSSLAKNSGSHAIGIVLSGTGFDGANGLIAISEAGGITLVQDPSTSNYNSMPNAAINTHMVDFIAEASELGRRLSQIIELDSTSINHNDDKGEDDYDKIINHIAKTTKLDFSHYKDTTMRRRITRRMAINEVHDIRSYFQFLKKNDDEVWSFVKDAFILVSQFYRDINAFDKLKETLTKKYQENHRNKTFRIWVPGCSTGEEAYTIAMILEDLDKELNLTSHVKILATDISPNAIDIARNANYKRDKLTNVPDHWLKDYFDLDVDNYQVKKPIRNRVIFSTHNVCTDPPFSRIDLISCRNLLIYFNPSLQDRALKIFNYSLNDSGILFLGASETGDRDQLFTPLHKNEKIYLKNTNQPRTTSLLTENRVNYTIRPLQLTKEEEFDHEKLITNSLIESLLPCLVVINQDNQLMYTSGKTSPFFVQETGLVSNDLFKMIVPEIRAECRALVYRARNTQEKVVGTKHTIDIDGELVTLVVSVIPLAKKLTNWLCIAYTYAPKTDDDDIKENSEISSAMTALEHELGTTRENLQTVIEELETANEQLLVSNQKMQSTNEEYQSTNEELQTVNEELQSTNEELITTNEEYAIKTAEQSKLSSDLANIQESIEIPFFVINTEYRIQRFTKSCSALIDTSKIKLDDLFFALQWYSELPQLKSLIKSVGKKRKIARAGMIVADRFYDCQVSPYLSANNRFDGFVVIFYDTTKYKNSQLALHTEKLMAQVTLETVVEGVLRIRPDMSIEYANPSALSILERDLDDLIDKRVDKRLYFFDEHGDDIDIIERINHCSETKDRFSSSAVPVFLKSQFGRDIYVELSISPLILANQGLVGNVIAFRDVSEKQTQLKKLEWQSQHDPLTGLVNRLEVEKRIDQSILSVKRDSIESTLLYLDLDQFKVINDTCGHLAGDRLLKQLSQMLMEMLRSRDTLGRLGGDEFALLLDKCPLVEAENIAKKVQSKISDFRFAWEDKVFRIGVSIGIVSINSDVTQISEVLSDADAACYAAKEMGRNAIQIHSRSNELLKKQRSQMHSISDINEAIENDMFRLYFQEIVEFNKEPVDSWEVMLRMFNKKGEFLMPMRFLPAAERFGLITRIDCWVLENTISRVSEYFRNTEKHLRPKININLSAHTITDETFIDLLSESLKKNDMPAENITFEITETAAISNFVKAQKFMTRAKSLGCKFALDDFGTGMSSLAYLRDLPIDTLKIDRSFIKNIVEDQVKSAIVNSVSEVAHLLSLRVVAEGVETEEQMQHLKTLSVDAIQGFHIAHPRPFEEFIAHYTSIEKPDSEPSTSH